MSKLFPTYLNVQIDDVDGEDIYRSVSEFRKDLPFEESESHPIRNYQLVRNDRINIENELLMLKSLYSKVEESIKSRTLRDSKYIAELEGSRRHYNKLKEFIIKLSLPNGDPLDFI